MALKVIGAGFGRTGTHSLKLALEQLEFAPCYHMVEVFTHPGHAERWEQAARDGTADWNALLGGYEAGLDWPVCHFWRQLAAFYPDAKVLLTERDPQSWYKSISQTIFEYMNHGVGEDADPIRRAQYKMGKVMIAGQTFAGRFDKDHVIDAYLRHNAAVKRGVPADRLLVYDVAQGWVPLCAFLGVAAPTAPFPLTNTTEDFRNRAPGRARAP